MHSRLHFWFVCVSCCRYRILFDLDLRVKIKKNWKFCKIMNFKTKKGKNKYNMIGRWIKKSQHLKKSFYNDKGQYPNWLWLKSWLFDLTIGLCWILDHLVGYIFPFDTTVYELKSELKWIRYHKNTENPNTNLHFF